MSRLLLAAGIALAACGPGLPCEGPSECGGNACCFITPTESGTSTPFVTCTASPTACAEPDTIDTRKRRMCHTDADCTAGGVTTAYTKCCKASVMGVGSHSCTSPSLCRI